MRKSGTGTYCIILVLITLLIKIAAQAGEGQLGMALPSATAVTNAAGLMITYIESGSILLGWPDNYYKLQRCSELAQPPNWADVTNATTLSNGWRQVALEPSGEKGFFRLAWTWTPALLGSKLVAWYEATNSFIDLAGTTRPTNGQTARLCKDLSGNGYDLTNNVFDGSQPTYRSDTALGTGALFFECNGDLPNVGDNPDWLSTRLDMPIWAQPNTVYVVSAKTEPSVYNHSFGYMFSAVNSSNQEFISAGICTDNVQQSEFQAGSPFTHWWYDVYSTNYHQFTGYFINAANTWIRVDGTNLQTANDMGGTGMQGVMMGAKHDHTHCFGGWIGGLWVIHGTLSDSEDQAMTTWLHSKYPVLP